MIEKMRKVTLITQRGGIAQALDIVSTIEALHVPVDESVGSSSKDVQTKITTLEKLTSFLRKVNTDKSIAIDELKEKSEYALDLLSSIREHEEIVSENIQRVEKLSSWGEFDHSLIEQFAKSGLKILFYALPKKRLTELDTYYHWIIKRGKMYKVCVLLYGDQEAPSSLRPIDLPVISLREAISLVKKHKKEAKKLRKLLAKNKRVAVCVATYKEYLQGLSHALGVQSVSQSDDHLEWITGFLPEKEIKNLSSLCRSHGIGAYFQGITPDDPVPTKLKKGVIANIAQPIFDVFGTIPGYKEFDIRSIFLLFFTLFFAMIVSDAGYAAIFTVIAFFALVISIFRRKNGYASFLFFLLSLAALAWGALSGSWFGNPAFLEIPLLQSFVLDFIWVDHPNNNVQISLLCMTIGLVHLFFAHFWRAMRTLIKGPRLQTLGELGWISLLIGLYYLVLSVVIDASLFPVPDFAWPAIFIGIAGVMLFGAQEGRFFRDALRGVFSIHTIGLDAIGMFSDIISYIRLYAVGLASLAVARSFTEMSESIVTDSTSTVLTVASILILVFGHLLNIAMTSLSVVVHGVRLNMLEFSRHLGMEWNGIQYKPLKSSPISAENKRRI